MKKLKLVLLLCLGIIQTLFAQVKDPIDLSLNHTFLQNLNGNIKKVSIEYLTDGALNNSEELIYVDNSLSERITKYKNGKQRITKMEYDKTKNLIAIIGFDTDNKKQSKISFKYNKEGNITEYKYEYTGSGTAVEKYSWENNKIKEIKIFEKSSKLIRTDLYNYLPSGKIDQISQQYHYENAPKIIQYNYEGDKNYSFKNSYHFEEVKLDDKGKIRTVNTKSNTTDRTDETIFNEQGWVIESSYILEGNKNITKYTYSFDDKKNVTKVIISLNDKIINEWNITYEYN